MLINEDVERWTVWQEVAMSLRCSRMMGCVVDVEVEVVDAVHTDDTRKFG